MMEFPSPGDLPPAPRRTPSAVLWLMFAVAVGGAALLIPARPREDVSGSVAAAQSRASALLPLATRPPSRPASTGGS
jgi:hypothetical protein